MERKIVLTEHAKGMTDRELLEAAILTIAEHPQVSYYLRRKNLVREK